MEMGQCYHRRLYLMLVLTLRVNIPGYASLNPINSVMLYLLGEVSTETSSFTSTMLFRPNPASVP